MIKTAKIEIKGTRPIIWHAFSEDALSDERKSKSGKAGNDPEEWKKTVLFHPENNQLYIPSTYIFGCLKNASVYTKEKRGSIQKKLMATLQVQDGHIYIKDRFLPAESEITRDINKPVYLDVCGVVNPSTKGRNVRYRIACSKGWECDFLISWDDNFISDKQMKQVLSDAGTLIGLADGRSMGNGRFEIVNFKIEN